jgi:hypothetical protein
MARFVLLAGLALAVVGVGNAGEGQIALAPSTIRTSIDRFDDVAGKWAGFASPHNHDVSLDIDARGRFTARYALGAETGNARIEGGTLVLPLVEHGGTLHLVRDGDTLKGPGQIGTMTWMVSLVRTGPAAPAK